jgi:hypothetical protein
LRVGAAPEARLGLAGTWLALAAASLVPCVLAVLLFRAARRGLVSFGGEGAAMRALVFLAWLFASADTLLVFGAVLRKTTHHHALAGATFALLGFVVLVVVGALARRVLAVARSAHRILGLAAFGLGVLPVLVALKVGPPASGVLVDALAYIIAVGFLSRASFASDRLLGVAGPPLAVVVLLIGLSSLRKAPLDTAIGARAPFLSVPVDLAAELVRRR